MEEEERNRLIKLLQETYEEYKKANLEYWNNTYYDEDGEFQIFGNINPNSLVRKIEETREQYNIAEIALEKWDRNRIRNV